MEFEPAVLSKEKKVHFTFAGNVGKVQNLENKVNSQSEKLDQIVKLLDDLSKEKSTT